MAFKRPDYPAILTKTNWEKGVVAKGTLFLEHEERRGPQGVTKKVFSSSRPLRLAFFAVRK